MVKFDFIVMNKYLRIFSVGFLMGAAEVVPGVSGGTIAFVSGFYDRLLLGLARMTPLMLIELPRVEFVVWWKKYDLGFLCTLFGAMLASVLIFARVVSFLLFEYPVGIWSFFLGLMLASVVVIGSRLIPLSREIVCMLGVGLIIGMLLSGISPMELESSGFVLFAGGFIAVCAWVLPGMSGSFLLLALGLYQSIVTAINSFDFLTLGFFGLGCITGLMCFSRILASLLERFRDLTVALLIGFMLGSFSKLWPWKYTTSYQIKNDGTHMAIVQETVLPYEYEVLTGDDPALTLAIFSFLAGFVVIVLMHSYVFFRESNAKKGAE